MSEYREESEALDTDILQVIDAWHRHGITLSDRDFNHLALRIFAYQLRYNQPYAQYCALFGITPRTLPTRWEQIPPVPTEVFKDLPVATFDPAKAALAFETSGTTQGTGGVHYMETPALYDAALLAGFDRFVLPDGARLRYLNVVPNPAMRKQSSLGYMMAAVASHRGDGQTGWYIQNDALLTHAFIEDLRAAIEGQIAVCIAGTAFGLLNLLDLFEQKHLRFELPPGSRIMETGGFKGRTRTVPRAAFYDKLALGFGTSSNVILAEYGMTELASQYYDSIQSRATQRRIKTGPPWMRTRVVDAANKDVPDEIVGALVHFDLANRSSAIAVSTEDLGARTPDGFVLLDRENGAKLRGCSLDAEDLRRA
ncbi:MAG: hypothetical protein ABR584_02425 [Candidatus Baltobacteraceae bacterium]